MIDPFVHMAKAQTMTRDISALRKAIRSFDAEASDKALDNCERWLTLVDCGEYLETARQIAAAPKLVRDQIDTLLGKATPRQSPDPDRPWKMDGVGRVTYTTKGRE